jgi:type II secretory pathway pseudopilin PulG
MKKIVLVMLAAQLAACAGRAPAPVAVTQTQDRYMDCAAINAEVQANNKKITELGSEEGKKVAQNVIVGAAGILIPVLWFGMDFQNAAGKEVAALQSRQQYLATLAEQRCGAAPPVPVQTVQMAAAAAVAAPTATATGPQIYRGKGATDAWCQSPAMVLTVNGGSVDGLLSENSNGTPTSTVKGSVANGQLTLSFTGSGSDYFTGEATGTQSGDSIQVAFKTKTTKACNYAFDLKPATTATPADLLK